jgi:hypothetical protein
MATIKKIVENYYETHTYSLPDLYVCGDMSCDVWDILKTEGITAKIQVGNVDKDISDIKCRVPQLMSVLLTEFLSA